MTEPQNPENLISKTEYTPVPHVPWLERSPEEQLEWIARGFQARPHIPTPRMGYFVDHIEPSQDNLLRARLNQETLNKKIEEFLRDFEKKSELFMLQHGDESLVGLRDPHKVDDSTGSSIMMSPDTLLFVLGIPQEEAYRIMHSIQERAQAHRQNKAHLEEFKPSGRQELANLLGKNINLYRIEKYDDGGEGYEMINRISVNNTLNNQPQFRQFTDERGFTVTELIRTSDEE